MFRHQLGLPALGVPEAFWIEAPIDAEWTVAYRMVPQHGRPVIAEVRVFPSEDNPSRHPGEWSATRLGATPTVPAGGVSTRLLRAMRLGSDVAIGLKAGNRYLQLVPAARPRLRRAGYRRLKRPHGHGGWSDENLLRAALFYVKRGGRRPVADLADAWNLTRSRARDLLQAAKEKGFLTPGTPGKTSRALTDRARELLQKGHDHGKTTRTARTR